MKNYKLFILTLFFTTQILARPIRLISRTTCEHMNYVINQMNESIIGDVSFDLVCDIETEPKSFLWGALKTGGGEYGHIIKINGVSTCDSEFYKEFAFEFNIRMGFHLDTQSTLEQSTNMKVDSYHVGSMGGDNISSIQIPMCYFQ